MSWFKTSFSEENIMSTSLFESRSLRAAATDLPVADTDPKLPQRPAFAPRPPARPPSQAEPTPSPVAQSSVLGEALRFKGELRADEDFVLQGRVEGSIHHTQNLTIGTEGVVKGDSRAATIQVDGTVEGDLYALESINLRPTARVQGNLLAPRIAIAEGATFNGKVDMASATRAVRHMSERQAVGLPESVGEEEILIGPPPAAQAIGP
jgi:cytoskeletal protein CcmA (bactofilin family)